LTDYVKNRCDVGVTVTDSEHHTGSLGRLVELSVHHCNKALRAFECGVTFRDLRAHERWERNGGAHVKRYKGGQPSAEFAVSFHGPANQRY
jgi:hypothetical protein